MEKKTLGIIGARGYTGRELIELVNRHRGFELAMTTSARDGATPEGVAEKRLDAYALALPNGVSGGYVDAITRARPDAVIVDLSADARFDDGWVYGQPERLREKIRGAKRVSNPGCYATAAQLTLAPIVPLLAGPPSIFGVSGYSGAGTTPSPRNDPEVLRENVVPYSLAGHIHEREVSRQLGCPLFLMPHVASFFRGLGVTVSAAFAAPQAREAIWARYEAAYGGEPLVRLSNEVPLLRDNVGKHHVAIGGLTLSEDGKHAVIVGTIDNLLAGAASQAMRNLNLMLGYPELEGLEPPKEDIGAGLPREHDAAAR